MEVKLINYSQSPLDFYTSGGEKVNIDLLDQVAYAARVSNPANQNNTDTSEKLEIGRAHV